MTDEFMRRDQVPEDHEWQHSDGDDWTPQDARVGWPSEWVRVRPVAATPPDDSEWPRRVKVIPFTETDDVTWAGRDGKPRCARHPGVCLVPDTAVGLTGDGHVCHQCMRETKPAVVPAADTATQDQP